MKYKRLTNSGTREAKQDTTISAVCGRLSDYEDSGLSPEEVQELVKVKVGDNVWLLLERNDSNKTDVVESKVVKIIQTLHGTFLSCWIDAPLIENSLEFDISELGKAVFCTKEEAEKALGGDITCQNK